MQLFTELFTQLDATTKTTVKVKALADYFAKADSQDALWVIALFTGKRPRRTVNTRLLREWAAELSNIPLWLFEESYHIAGDLAETIALVTPPSHNTTDKPLSKIIAEIKALAKAEEEEEKTYILSAWNSMDTAQRFLSK